MALAPCINPGQVCPPDSALANLSSEGPDCPAWVSVAYPDHLGPGSIDDAPLGSTTTGAPQVSVTTSCLSQEDSDSSANTATRVSKAAQQFPATTAPTVGPGLETPPSTPGPPTVTPPVNPPVTPPVVEPGPSYGNQEQTCAYQCPGGGLFQSTVPAGQFVRATQALADSAAYNTACQQAATEFICLPALPANCCVGLAFSASVVATGGVQPIAYTVSSGTLPPGLSLALGNIMGTPTGTGTFTFEIQALDATGKFDQRIYTMASLAISPNPVLATATVPFNVQFSFIGGVAPLAFVVVGSTPIGLSLSPVGVLSGTVGTAGTFSLTIAAEDSTGSICQQPISLVVSPAPHVVKNISGVALGLSLSGGTLSQKFTWTWDTANGVAGQPGANNSYSITAAGDTVASTARSDSSSNYWSTLVYLHGYGYYTGPSVQCHINISALTVAGPSDIGLRVTQDGTPVLQVWPLTGGPQILTFTLVAGSHSLIEIGGGISAGFPTLLRLPAIYPGPTQYTDTLDFTISGL